MEIGQTYFGKYKIIKELGEGGFGRVYLAEENFGRQVAIKTLRWELPEEAKQEARDRFEREIRIGLHLSHPHILRALTYERDDEIYLVMDYIPGGSLADWLRQLLDEDRRPDPETVLRYVRQICEALDYLHHFRRQCYVHRDVTPNNILLDENDRARLMDFGLIQEPGSSTRMASWCKPASHPGTPVYQSPEARAGEPVLLAASDVYMLGAVLFELLTGYPYFHKQDVPPSKLEPGLSSDLDDVVMKAVAEDPKERYRSAADFEQALAVVAEQLATQRRAQMQGYADQIEGALEAGDWAEALAACDTLDELDSAYPGLNKWREQARAGQQAEEEAAARERTRQARLAELYKTIQAARQAGDWQAVLDRCDELLDLEPDYRAAAHLKTEAEAKLARQARVAELYDSVQAAHQTGKWQTVLHWADELAALEPDYRDAAQLRAEAESQRQAELARLYETVQTARQTGEWQTVLDRCDELAKLEPGYRDTVHLKAEAKTKLDRQAEAEQLRRQAESEARQRAAAETRLREETARRQQAKAATEQLRRQKQGSSSSAGLVVVGLVVVALVGAGLLWLGSGGDDAAAVATAKPSSFPLQGEGRGGGQDAATLIPPTNTAAPTSTRASTPSPVPDSFWDAVVLAAFTSLRLQPDLSATSIITLNSGDNVDLLAVNEDRSWVQAVSQARTGWLPVDKLKINIDIDSLPIKDGASTRTSLATPRPTRTPVPPPAAPANMVFVPGGPFIMGSDNNRRLDEKPDHTVEVGDFWIDRTEVTNAQFSDFLNEMGNREEGGETWLGAGDRDARIRQSEGTWQAYATYADHPVVEVTWYGAKNYCEWRDGRLPTEAEWEKAARGTDGRTYPWGDEFDGNAVNFCDTNCPTDWSNKDYDDGYAFTAPVGSFPSGASPYGALDMVGNVWEWTLSEYQDYPYNAADGRENTNSTNDRVIRGGSWKWGDNVVRVAFRADPPPPTHRSSSVGFRCIQQTFP